MKKAIIVDYYTFFGELKSYVGICDEDKIDQTIDKMRKENSEIVNFKVVNVYQY